MSKSYRPGSEGAAQAKTAKYFNYGMAIVVALSILAFVIPSNLYTHGWFVKAAVVSKVFGFLVAGAWYFFLFNYSSDAAYGKKDSGAAVSVILFFSIVLIWALLAGFNFSL